MLDWLKTILGDAYTEEIDKKVSQEIGKAFVSRKDFNEKNDAAKQLEKTVAERDKQLEDLKGSTGDVDSLKQEIAKLQQQNKDEKAKHDAEVLRIRTDNAVEAALVKAGARNTTATKALLAEFLTKAELADDGTVKGLDGQIEALKKGESTAFLFNTPNGQQIVGMQPGTPGGNPPPAGKKIEEMSYTELSAYLAANPGAKL